MEGIMAPSESGSGAVSAALYVNDRFSRLYSNAIEQPEVTGLHLTDGGAARPQVSRPRRRPPRRL